MAVCRHCFGSLPSQGCGNNLDSCMNQSMTVRRPSAVTIALLDMEEVLLSWGPALDDCSRPNFGTFTLVLVNTEPRSCLHWNKCGTCCTLSTNGTMGLSEGALQ